MKKVNVNIDDFGIIQLVITELKVSEEKAVSILLETGLVNLLTHNLPEELKKAKQQPMNEFLAKPEIQKLSEALRTIWSI